jgi:hypothetical protein
MAAEPELPDYGALQVELAQLQTRFDELDRRHSRLEDRLVAFPNEFHRAQERVMADELVRIRGLMHRIEAQLINAR